MIVSFANYRRQRPGDLVTRARVFATEAHEGQKYGSEPYEVHLSAVVNILTDSGVTDPEVLAAGWLHDVLEDTSRSLFTLYRSGFSARVNRLVIACTGVGQTRKARVQNIYDKIAKMPEAAVVKLADRIANVEAAAPGSRHLARYRAEQQAFAAIIRPHVPAAMWGRLEAALNPPS